MIKNEDEIIQADLENILKSVALSENIKNYEVFSNNNPIQGEGVMSVFFDGKILNKDNDNTIQVAIKKAPIGGFTAGFGIEAIYKNEIYFYSEAFPELDKFQKEKKVKDLFNHIPKYLAGNLEPTNMFVAMENLKTAGYVLFDKKKYFDRKHLEFIFKTYGKWHALSFVFKQKNEEENTNLMNNFIDVMEKLMEADAMMELMNKSYSTAIETFDPATEAEILVKLKAVDYRETLKRVQTYKGSYTCLIHGDCWSNNMLFKYQESGELEDLKLIDFQLSRLSTPIHDISYFFYAGASKEDMDKLDYYLDLYYQSFSNFARELGGNPEEIFPLEILKKDWKEYGVWGVFAGCQLWLLKLTDREEIVNMLQQKGLTEANYMDLWYEKISEICAGADYRERVRNICLHAVEYGII